MKPLIRTMKKKRSPKKKRSSATEQPKSAPRMTRREARIAARLSEEQRERRNVFNERMRNAPRRMRVQTVRTKGYYRFAKEYPADRGADGFRENRPPVRRMSKLAKWLTVLACVAAFCVAFIGTRSAMLISAMPGDTDYMATPTDAMALHGIKALRFTAEELADSSAEQLKRKLDAAGCNVALFEYKNEAGQLAFSSTVGETVRDDDDGFDWFDGYDGYGYYDEDGYYQEFYDEYEEYGYYDEDGDYHLYDAYDGYDEEDDGENDGGEEVTGGWKTVGELEEMGIRTAAYISCFRDSAAASENESWAIRDFDEPDEPLYDSDGYLWLDPYQPEVTAYLTGLMQEALNGGFSYVVLDHVSFPYDLGLRTAYFSGADVADQADNSILLDFLAQALNVTGTKQMILMCDVNGLTADAMARDNRYGGSLLTCGAEVFAVDARLSMQPENEPDPLGLFSYKEDVPNAFILSVCSKAYEAAKDSEYVDDARVMVCVENDGNDAALKELLDHTGLEDFIIW